MLIASLLLLANAGELVVDAQVPVEVFVDGTPRVQLFSPGQVRLEVPEGDRSVSVYRGGRPERLTVTIPSQGHAHLAVGRVGITTHDVPAPEPADTAPVELRLVGKESLRVYLGDDELRLNPETPHRTELPRGAHPLSVRNASGTVVFASGAVDVFGTGPVVVHLSAGRAPEVVGASHGAWRPAGL